MFVFVMIRSCHSLLVWERVTVTDLYSMKLQSGSWVLDCPIAFSPFLRFSLLFVCLFVLNVFQYAYTEMYTQTHKLLVCLFNLFSEKFLNFRSTYSECE